MCCYKTLCHSKLNLKSFQVVGGISSCIRKHLLGTIDEELSRADLHVRGLTLLSDLKGILFSNSTWNCESEEMVN